MTYIDCVNFEEQYMVLLGQKSDWGYKFEPKMFTVYADTDSFKRLFISF